MTLLERQKHGALDFLTKELPAPGTTSFTRKQEPLGLGHAVWCARELIGNEPFALLLPDVLVQHERGCLAQMMDAARGLSTAANIVAVEEVPNERVDQYGVVGVGEHIGKMFSITSMVEKPPRDRAPSNLILTGRYILQPEILEILGSQERGTGGEIQLTDAMIQLAKRQPFYGLKFDGRSFDCGSKIGFLAANVSYALSREDIAPGFRAEIKKMLGD
jgi:UTP--glucose-1-phosphate uridylyltransferase